jgi:ribose-phosphate pyrophosphokinase
MLVIDGPSGNGIGRSIASALGCEFLESLHNIFPDGESEVGIGSAVKGKDVLLVQSTYPLQDKRMIELLLLADDAKKQGAKSVSAVVPYLAYARQDERHAEKGNAVSINTILSMLSFSGITTLITVAPHNTESLSSFDGRVTIVDAVPPLAEAVKKNVSNPFVLAPDKGALDLARRFAKVLGCGCTNINKHRDKLTGKLNILNAPKEDFNGKEVVIVDDMISTGGTIEQTSRFAHANGASKVVVAAAHLLMAGNAYDRITAAGVKELYGTNTIPYDKAHIVDISGAIAKALSNPSPMQHAKY